jgi:hypothetical protein
LALTTERKCEIMIPSADTLRRAGEILQEIEKFQAELVSLFGGSGGAQATKPRRGRPPGKRRRMSPEARARIAAAARARWARYRSDKKGGSR